MKTIEKLLRLGVLAVLVALLPAPLWADDSEIFFAEAAASEDENKPAANVMLLLDTSGSMRYCATGSNANWCSDYTNRRINMLVTAVNTLLDGVQDGVSVGVSRFRYRNGSNGGAEILVPVTEVTPDSKQVLKAQVSALNSAGTSSSGSGSPEGGTPTAEAYMELARYMMGKSPYYDSSSDRDVCVAYGSEEYNCRDVVTGYGEYVELVSPATCNPSLNTCRAEYGSWRDIAGSCDSTQPTCQEVQGSWQAIAGTCNTYDNNCRINGYGDWYDIAGTCSTWYDDCRRFNWSDWTTTISSGANDRNCPEVDTSTFERDQQRSGRTRYCRERTRQYQMRDPLYEQRAVEYQERDARFFERDEVLEEVCDARPVCINSEPLVSGGNYVSPMNLNNECETNHVVIFTDGTPSGDDPGNHSFVNCSGDSSYQCQGEISRYLNRAEQTPASSASNAKNRPVKTYNIGLHMGTNVSSMRSVSTDGADGTFNATDAASLATAFNSIFDLIAEDSRSFASPGVAVNQMNRLQHLNELYYAVFKPQKSSVWKGNLKRFEIENGAIHGVDGPAVDPDTGYFSANATSFWTSEAQSPDGPDVNKGGARERIGTRTLKYTDAAGVMQTLDWDNANDPTFFGLPAASTQLDDLKAQLQVIWGDPLHSEPALVNYGTTAENNVIFASTNAGMMHAVDSQTGVERFAFMPKQLLERADEFTVNARPLAANNSRQTYGMDGSWTPWRRPGATPIAAPRAVYLYGGMRRGGYSYFGLNVSNLNSPSLLWQIDRGDTGFERLGQTWSQPTLTQVMVNSVKTPVLVFGGGYSPADHDSKQGMVRNSGDVMGNSIYVVNALTGDLLWSAGANESGAGSTTVSAMKWAIPAGLSVVDYDFDGVADNLYFGDLGGQVFRVDFDDANVTSSAVRVLAQLSSSTRADGNRRFFYPPAVAFHQDETSGDKVLYVTMGSGYRAHPLDEAVDDYFYVIKDSSALEGEAPAEVFTGSDLATLSSEGTLATFGMNGWKLPLANDGEKATASPVVFDGRIFFTSYEPGSSGEADACSVRVGTSYLYVVGLVTGQGVTLSGEVVPRKRTLQQDVPPPTPALISDGENVLIVIGAEVAESGNIAGVGVRRGSWHQLQSGEPDAVPVPAP
ncbi:MAG: hypothetical protein KBT87_09070 [Gammaproteobacteria bacterium]|nr:hypothetical protein [Gammaproteobacteria bacterium]MBQ0774810.1 hypothetical protein [Gammaproteobacteria bacterium]